MPDNYINALLKCDINNIIEIRLRLGYPVILIKTDKRNYLCNDGQTLLESGAIICSKTHIEQIILNLTDKSIYAYADNINNGYLTWKNGIRVGVVGDCVFEKNKIINVKNIRFLNIRIPHEIINSSKDIFKIIYTDRIYNTLIVSKPLKGKTTIIKDLIRNFNSLNKYNILVIDERGELYNSNGLNVDIISNCIKSYAFEIGLRSMSPDIVFTDELSSKEDVVWISKAINYGVKIIATCHGENFNDVMQRNFDKIFDKIIILDSNQIGEIKELVCNKL